MSTDSNNQPTLFGHPTGLFVLFFAEMWERFSYYGMRAILTLYMITSATKLFNPGLGWSNGNALAMYGWYTMLVYVMSIPGGILADKFIGQKRSVFLGGMLLVVGQFTLAIDALWAFYTGLLLIIFGVGALKPNISTMVGGLYPKGDPRRDQGFTLFYIGINVGAMLSSLIVGAVGETIGWHYGFALAGFGMLLGQITFVWGGKKYLKGVGGMPTKAERLEKTESTGDSSFGELLSNLIKSPVQLIITLVLGAASIYFAMSYASGFDRYSYSALGVFLALVIGFLMMIYKDVDSIEKDRFVVLIISFLIVIVFWGAFEQAGGLMNIYTRDKIDRVVSLFSIDLLFIVFIGALLVKTIVDKIKKNDTFSLFLVLTIILTAVYGILRFYMDVFTNPYEIPASVFQSVNAFFIMIFGTIVGGFWILWAKWGKENSSLFKMAVGTIVMGIGFLFMAKASTAVHQYGDKAALILLILAYLFHTLGELSASPVALSFVTKVAPVKYVSIMMGVYFAATGLGNKVAGSIGESAQAEPIEISLSSDFKVDEFSNDKIDTLATKGYDFELVTKGHVEGDHIVLDNKGVNVMDQFDLTSKDEEHLKEYLTSDEDIKDYTVILRFGYDETKTESVRSGAEPVDYKAYAGNVEVFEVQNRIELRTFLMIFAFTAAFGILLLLFLKRLKKLTHGAEDIQL